MVSFRDPRRSTRPNTLSPYPTLVLSAVVSGPVVTGDPEDAFTVTEDGEDQEVDVVRLRSNDLNVVVAVDVSGSMAGEPIGQAKARSEEHTSELQSLMRITYAVFCLKTQIYT